MLELPEEDPAGVAATGAAAEVAAGVASTAGEVELGAAAMNSDAVTLKQVTWVVKAAASTKYCRGGLANKRWGLGVREMDVPHQRRRRRTR